jgi:hypothetical protein
MSELEIGGVLFFGWNSGFNPNFGSGSFDQCTSVFDPREFQFGAKLIF